MARESVSVGHRYVRTLLNALVVQCGTQVKAEEILRDAWAPGMKPEDQERLLVEIRNLQQHPVLRQAQSVAVENPPKVEAPASQPSWLGVPPFIEGSLDDVLGELLGKKPVVPVAPPHPLVLRMKQYAEEAAAFFQKHRYLMLPLDHKRVVVVEGKPYVFMYTAVLRRGSQAINLNGTSGSVKKLLDLDETYLAMPNGISHYVHECALDGFDSAAFSGFAAHLVPKRNFRFWVSRRDNGEGQDVLKIYTTMGEDGCIMDSTTVSSKVPDYVGIFK